LPRGFPPNPRLGGGGRPFGPTEGGGGGDSSKGKRGRVFLTAEAGGGGKFEFILLEGGRGGAGNPGKAQLGPGGPRGSGGGGEPRGRPVSPGRKTGLPPEGKALGGTEHGLGVLVPLGYQLAFYSPFFRFPLLWILVYRKQNGPAKKNQSGGLFYASGKKTKTKKSNTGNIFLLKAPVPPATWSDKLPGRENQFGGRKFGAFKSWGTTPNFSFANKCEGNFRIHMKLRSSGLRKNQRSFIIWPVLVHPPHGGALKKKCSMGAGKNWGVSPTGRNVGYVGGFNLV